MKRVNLSQDGQINVATLKARLAEFLRRVKAGGEITILEHKMPIAKIIPLREDVLLESIKPIGNFSVLVKALKIPPLKQASVDSLKLLMEERGPR